MDAHESPGEERADLLDAHPGVPGVMRGHGGVPGFYKEGPGISDQLEVRRREFIDPLFPGERASEVLLPLIHFFEKARAI